MLTLENVYIYTISNIFNFKYFLYIFLNKKIINTIGIL